MIVLDKQTDKVFILYNPQRETAFIGENLVICDKTATSGPNGVIAQVIEERPYIPYGMKESLLLESLAPKIEATTTIEELGAARSELRNQKLIVAKIRLSSVTEENGKVNSLIPWNGWSPTPGCTVSKLTDEEILSFVNVEGKSGKTVTIGKTWGNTPYKLNMFYLHGVTVLLGGRNTGKSHLAKKIALRLVDEGKKVIVFDINDEWSAMRFQEADSTGKAAASPYYKKILKLDPGVNMGFELDYLGKQVFISVLRTMRMEETSPSVQSALNIWNDLEKNHKVSLENLKAGVASAQEKVKEALLTRLNQLENSGIIRPSGKGTTIESLLSNEDIKNGGLLVINLKDKNVITQFIIVQLFIAKLSNILSNPANPALVLILEEAQTYMEHSDIGDIVTRLRHLGLHQMYITNTPQSLPSFLLSHITNWFVFNLVNDQDILYLANSLPLDLESANIFIKMLPPKNTLVLVNEMYQNQSKNYPLMVQVEPLQYQAAGTTRELFDNP
jgi:hypothetical protein